MDKDTYEKRMRAQEYFHNQQLLPGTWAIIRVDGRGFSRFTEEHYVKPFDDTFYAHMKKTTHALLTEMYGHFAFVASDEISVLCRPEWDMFDRNLEKIVSISASVASATFTHASHSPVFFDSRVWLGANFEQVLDYFRWRQAHATRGALNGWCYWTLRNEGQTASQVTALIESKSVAFKNEMLFQHGINFNELPTWQRRGAALFWETFEKAGFDPIQQREVTSTRRRIAINEDLPMKEDYDVFIQSILNLEGVSK